MRFGLLMLLVLCVLLAVSPANAQDAALVAIAVTPSNDGVLRIPVGGAAAFAVAAINYGPSFASVKRNPGQRAHAQCGARGYTNVRSRWAAPVPPIVPGVSRMLQATLKGNDLTVLVDGAVAWKSMLPVWIADFDGPVGLRSDNVRFEFEYYVGGLATPS